LLLFPIMSSITCLIVAASFVIPLVMYVFSTAPGDLHKVNEHQQQQEALQNAVYYIWLFAFYFVNFLVIIFFNTALVSCALVRFSGGTPTVADGLRTACARLPQIVGWALLSATVGMLLKILEQRLSILGKIVVSLIGLAWTIATYLVIPILAAEKMGPLAAVQRSASLLRKSWGEALTGGVSLRVVSLVLSIPGILLILGSIVLGATLGQSVSVFVLFIPAVLGVLYIIGLSIVISTLQQIFLAGVYLYAAEGRVADGFSEDTLASAFKVKR
jgi:hypothetical protein